MQLGGRPTEPSGMARAAALPQENPVNDQQAHCHMQPTPAPPCRQHSWIPPSRTPGPPALDHAGHRHTLMPEETAGRKLQQVGYFWFGCAVQPSSALLLPVLRWLSCAPVALRSAALPSSSLVRWLADVRGRAPQASLTRRSSQTHPSLTPCLQPALPTARRPWWRPTIRAHPPTRPHPASPPARRPLHARRPPPSRRPQLRPPTG